MIFYLFLAVYFVGTAIGMYKLFEKAGLAGWKAFVPVLNLATLLQLVGRPLWHLIYLLIPVVNLFYWAYVMIETANSFGKYTFLDHFYAGVLPFWFFPKIGFNTEDRYLGGDFATHEAFTAELKAAGTDMAVSGKVLRKYSQYEKGTVRDWAETIVFAVFAASFIRMFCFEMYVIPTPSMEGSLLVGDYLAVSKLSYGLRTPKTILSLPLLHNVIPYLGIESYSDASQFDYHRFKIPFLSGDVARYDPVVFNFPAGDIVALPLPTAELKSPKYNQDMFFGEGHRTDYDSYQRMLGADPSIQQVGVDKFIHDNFKVFTRPVDKRDFFIKRCVGLPGDKIEVKDRALYVNGAPATVPEMLQFSYTVVTKEALNEDGLLALGIDFNRSQEQPNLYQMFLHQSQVDALKKWKEIEKIEARNDPAGKVSRDVFPQDTVNFKFNMDNYGPIVLPKKGEVLQLNANNIAYYRRLITAYEGNTLKVEGNSISINGKPTTTYTCQMDYYWMMGDNRHNSEDSRVWGYVPEDHIAGKPLFIWFHKGKNGIDFSRFFTGAKRL